MLDLGIGLLGLLSQPMPPSGQRMGFASSELAAILLLILGGAVLATAIYTASMPMPKTRIRGALMLVYGILMLLAGTAMLGGLVSMIQGSALWGAAMIGVGVGMLFSGATMRAR